jgi:hypothetical protein
MNALAISYYHALSNDPIQPISQKACHFGATVPVVNAYEHVRHQLSNVFVREAIATARQHLVETLHNLRCSTDVRS